MRNKATAPESISSLLRMVTENKLCLPSFQRQFVWTPTQIAKLMESIVRHYPIGTLMLLKKEGNPNLMAEAFLGDHYGDFTPQFYVIDGQQRLKALLFALKPPTNPENQYVHLQHRYRFYFKVDMKLKEIRKSEEVEKLTFIKTARNDEPLEHDKEQLRHTKLLPLSVIYKKNESQWLNVFPPRFRRTYRKNVGDLRRQILSYSVPVETLQYKLSERQHSNVFALINSEGTGLTEFELAAGKLYPIKMKELWREANKKKIEEYGIDPTYILKVMLLIKDKDRNAEVSSRAFSGMRSRYMENGRIDIAKFRQDWRVSTRFINMALSQFEAQFGVMNRRYLPFSPMVVTYAAILHYLQVVKKYSPDKEKRINNKLKKWYWASVINQRYKAGTNSVIRNDYQRLKEWIEPRKRRTPSRFAVKMTEDELERLIARTRNGADAVYRAIVCLPNIQERFDIYSGQAFSSSKVNDHHIYPRKRLPEQKYGADEINQVANRVITCERANKQLQDDWPWKHLAKVSKRHLKNYFIPLEIMKDRPTFRQFASCRRRLLAKRVASLLRYGE
jgi:hypothetical protein